MQQRDVVISMGVERAETVERSFVETIFPHESRSAVNEGGAVVVSDEPAETGSRETRSRWRLLDARPGEKSACHPGGGLETRRVFDDLDGALIGPQVLAETSGENDFPERCGIQSIFGSELLQCCLL